MVTSDFLKQPISLKSFNSLFTVILIIWNFGRSIIFEIEYFILLIRACIGRLRKTGGLNWFNFITAQCIFLKLCIPLSFPHTNSVKEIQNFLIIEKVVRTTTF